MSLEVKPFMKGYAVTEVKDGYFDLVKRWFPTEAEADSCCEKMKQEKQNGKETKETKEERMSG